MALIATLAAAPVHAGGWYQVRNYTGTIGHAPVHLSLQTYDWLDRGQPDQRHVDGSYYYDRHHLPIPLQGKRQADGQIRLCEAAEPTSFAESPVVPAPSPQHPVPCQITLHVTEAGATGEWNDGSKQLPITLHQTGRLDDTSSGAPRLDGVVDIPMWHHTKTHLLLGIYKSSATCPLSMSALRLVNLRSGKTDKAIKFDCGTGTIATSIYANVYRSQEPGHVTVILPGGFHGMGEDTDVQIEP